MRSTDAWNGAVNSLLRSGARANVLLRAWRGLAIVVLIGVAMTGADRAGAAWLRGPDGAEVRGLVIGIDAYSHVRQLKGAVADARDVEAALRRMATRDVVTLIDAAANRASVMQTFEQLLARTQSGDLVFISIAGHGSQEPERVKGSEPDGLEDVFLLADFEPHGAGSQQRILGEEFNHFIKALEAKGARVVFVADTCHGGGLVREIDPRAEEMSYRQVPRYVVTDDELKPISTTSDAWLTEFDFQQTAFLAAVDRQTKAPEVRIPGIPGLRGALSYAVARAIEGNADGNRDGKITAKELFTNVRQVVYELSDQRQNIVTMTSPKRDLETDVVFELTRGVKMLETVPETPKPTAVPVAAKPAPVPATPSPAAETRPVRIAVLDGQSAALAGLAPQQAAFEVVRPVDDPDLIWDPHSHDVVAWGDVVAYHVDTSDLPAVIDRAAAIRELKQMTTKAPQSIRVTPNDALHHNRSIVDIEVSDVAGRALIMFDVSGDGTVQTLYPIGSDPPIISTPQYRFPVRVRDPFGADQIVAITSEQRMTALEQVLMQLNRRRDPGQILQMVQRYAPPDAKIGSTGLFTAP